MRKEKGIVIAAYSVSALALVLIIVRISKPSPESSLIDRLLSPDPSVVLSTIGANEQSSSGINKSNVLQIRDIFLSPGTKIVTVSRLNIEGENSPLFVSVKAHLRSAKGDQLYHCTGQRIPESDKIIVSDWTYMFLANEAGLSDASYESLTYAKKLVKVTTDAGPRLSALGVTSITFLNGKKEIPVSELGLWAQSRVDRIKDAKNSPQ